MDVVDAVQPDQVMVDPAGLQCSAGPAGRRRAARRCGARPSHGVTGGRRGLRVPTGVAEGVRPRPGLVGRAARTLRPRPGRLHRRLERRIEKSCAAPRPGDRRVRRARRRAVAELSAAVARPGADRAAATARVPGLGRAGRRAARRRGRLALRAIRPAVGVREFRQFPLGPGRRAGPGGHRVAGPGRPGGAGHRVGRPLGGRGVAGALAGPGIPAGWSSCAEPPWRSPTGATTV